MKFGDIELRKDTNGEYLELKERNSKTLDGSKPNDYRATRPKIYSIDDSELCPVKLFKKFIDKRPLASLQLDSPFYLTPIPLSRFEQQDDQWYYNQPMGHNTLENLMKMACTSAGIKGKKTNHSLRKSTVSELTEAGVPATKIIKITGHKNVSSLQHYDGPLKSSEQKSISNILCGQNNRPSTSNSVKQSNTNQINVSGPPSTSTGAITSTQTASCTISNANSNLNINSSQLTSIFSHTKFENCSFTINVNK